MSDWSDLGAQLRKERETRGWTTRDVAHHTRIPAPTIEKLEANDYRDFPSPAYAKSFLAQYSDHLEVDATEWLDAFETGNSLSNLDSYGYLKNHDERIGEEIIPVMGNHPKPARARKKAEPASGTPSGSAHSFQPLVVFAITAMLLTAGAFGYRHISEEIAKSVPEATDINDQSHGFVEAPSIVHSRPAPSKPIVRSSGEPPIVAATDPRDDRRMPAKARAMPIESDITPITFDAPPPRAVIIEE